MARANNLIPNFTGGEISPRTAARRDVEGFYNSTEYQLNFISDVQGGARFRGGTTVKYRAAGTRLLPFVFDALDVSFVEVGTSWIRILDSLGNPRVRVATANNTWTVQRVEKRTGQVVFHVSGGSYTELVTSGLYVLSSVSPELDDSYRLFSGENIGGNITAVNTSTINAAWREVVVSVSFTVADAAVTPAQTMLLYRCEAVASTYTEAEINRLQFAQRNDSMWMTVGTKRAKQLLRLSTGAFTFTDAQIYNAVSGTTDLAELTTANNYPYCVTIYEDRLWYGHTDTNPNTIWGSNTGIFNRFFVSTPGVASDRFRGNIGQNSDDIIFMLGDRNILYCGTINGAVGVSGGGPNQAITLSSFKFSPLHNVGTAFGRPYFNYEDSLFFVDRVGTGLWKVQYNYNTEKYQPTNVSVAADHLTKRIVFRASTKTGDDGRIFLITNEGNIIFLTYSEPLGVSAFSRGESYPGFKFTDVCSLPSPIFQDTLGAYLTNEFGQRYFVLFQPEVSTNLYQSKDQARVRSANEIEATKDYYGYLYAKQLATNYLDGGFELVNLAPFAAGLIFAAQTGTGVNVNSTAPIFQVSDVGRRILINPLYSRTRAYRGLAVITAYVDASNVTVTIEQDLNDDLVPIGGWYFSVPAGTTVSLPSTIYAGYDVDLVLDGVVYPPVSIDTFLTFTLPADTYIGWVGFKYTGVLKTVNMLGVGSLGTSEHLLKNIAKLGVRFFETGQQTSYGTMFYRLENLDFAQLDDPTDRPAPLFTGEKIIRFDENWQSEKSIYIKHDGGTPCSVLSLVPFFNTSSD